MTPAPRPGHPSGQGRERQGLSKLGLRSISLKDRSCFKDGLSSMNLRYRSFHPRDATACQQLLQRYPEYSPQVFAALPTFWKRLFDEQAIIAAVIEDCQPGMPGTIVAFGADVFVTDGFMAEARAGCEPGIVNRLIRGELYDKLTPILRLDAIARANAGAGLNVIIIHNGLPELPTSVSMQAIGFKFQEAFTWAHRGYRIKEILHEVWDETDREWVRALHRLRADYSDFYGQSLCVPGVRPYLFGITREEAFENTGSITAPLFWYTPPRFQFRQGARELLTQALEGTTDVELAKALSISLPAVKMRWRAIYRQVESAAPELFPPGPGHASENSRGKEKRRCIVEYVRNHPEELRPYCVRGMRRSEFRSKRLATGSPAYLPKRPVR